MASGMGLISGTDLRQFNGALCFVDRRKRTWPHFENSAERLAKGMGLPGMVLRRLAGTGVSFITPHLILPYTHVATVKCA